MNEKPTVQISKEDSALNIDSTFLSIFSLGQRRLIADFFWIATLLESDLEHVKKDSQNSWMFLRFKTISELDPLFLKNYQFGGQYLNIIKNDLLGAEYIFRSGLKFYPDNYELLFNAGFLFAFEIRDFPKALSIYKKLSKFKTAPKYLPSLINKLKYKTNPDIDLAFNIVKSSIETVEPNSALYRKLRSDLYAIKATRDLSCLNLGQKNCQRFDLDGKPYIKIKSIFKSQKKFRPYDLSF
jgi:hypothetical protein